MITRADITFALMVGIPLALVTMLAFRFGPTFSESVGGPNMPIEQYLALSRAEQEAFLHASPQSLRSISGFEKVSYVLRAEPGLHLAYSLVLAVPMCGAVLLGSWAARRRQEPNPGVHTDAQHTGARR